MKVGDVVRNKLDVLGNRPGTRGVVYDIYQDFDDPADEGISVIFENGEYDGFSYQDQLRFLEQEHLDYIPFFVRGYSFSNVMQLSRDFTGGMWDEIFRQPK